MDVDKAEEPDCLGAMNRFGAVAAAFWLAGRVTAGGGLATPGRAGVSVSGWVIRGGRLAVDFLEGSKAEGWKWRNEEGNFKSRVEDWGCGI